ncbi:MAG: hypothetical protein RLZZ267_310 [Bacillota bacterium]|jgi:hypothetical protein
MKTILVTVMMLVAVVGLFTTTISGDTGLTSKISTLGTNAGTAISAINP